VSQTIGSRLCDAPLFASLHSGIGFRGNQRLLVNDYAENYTCPQKEEQANNYFWSNFARII
jgi:hypothetical protein